MDLVAPAILSHYFTPPGNAYAFTPPFEGTSVSSPIVAANGGLFRNALYSYGLGTADARSLMVNLLLLGNGWSAEQGSITSSGMDWLSGAGRLKMHWPSTADLTPPWNWNFGARFVAPGQDAVWSINNGSPLSGSVTQFKFVTMYTAADLNNVPDVDFYVEDTCPPGGGPPVIIASDTGYDIRSRFRLEGLQIQYRCLQLRAHAYSVPPEGMAFYLASLYHSGPTWLH